MGRVVSKPLPISDRFDEAMRVFFTNSGEIGDESPFPDRA
jgi:hypothetical protein